ncbi:TonB-dependent receptor plug domain-containing protein [Desulfoferrobacter suflitae]|uniref:TonB-dependent receptor plug domain-containing protein n=1 Tax=Desulfoferrobacter suflitae TaxID=2865782 RepID=UPI002164046F|nr:TonB-dependent receptor [Desulfoferrobacter suflitae]MCK8603657.1 TonB-dependent receptor [Desulfoferrobacter suflitae]
MRKQVLLLVFMCFAAGVAAAEEKPLSLEEIVVSSTRTETSTFDATQSVTVITEEEIMASPFERVEDIVRSMAGMYNFRYYTQQTNGIQSPLILRGAGKNKVLLMVDGVPQNDNFNNAVAWVAWGHIPKEAIQRIEVVRGPSSALYGSEGLGGIIHIITKKPAKERKTHVTGMTGTGDTFGGSMFHSQSVKDFGLLATGGYEGSNGFFMDDPLEDFNTRRYRNVGQVLAKATYDVDPHSNLDVSGIYYEHDMGKGREFFYDELELDQYWLTYTRQSGSLGLKGLVYLNRSDKTAYQDTASDDYSSLSRIENYPSTYTWGADLQSNFQLAEWSSLVVGAAYKKVSWGYDEDYTTSSRDAGAEGQQDFVSPFVSADFRFFDDRLIANIGARYDWIQNSDGKNWDTKPEGGITPYDNSYDSSVWNNFSPKAGIAFHPDQKTTLRASGGTGFRAPSLFELYKVHVRSGGTYYRYANPDLDPEKIISYDIGVERFLLNNLMAKLTFYQSFASDYIGDKLVKYYEKSGKIYNEYKIENIDKVDIYGIELETEWSPRNDLTLFGNYTYNISKINENKDDENLEGNYLTNDPRHKVHLGIWYKNPKIVNVYFLANYYADIFFDTENTQKVGNFWTLDFSLSRKLFERFTLGLDVQNLLDKEYLLSTGSNQDTIAPGRIIIGRVKVEF